MRKNYGLQDRGFPGVINTNYYVEIRDIQCEVTNLRVYSFKGFVVDPRLDNTEVFCSLT